MKFKHDFIDVPKLEQVTEPDRRYYNTPDGNKYPSITTVLGRTKDMTKLMEGRKELVRKKQTESAMQLQDMVLTFIKSVSNTFLTKISNSLYYLEPYVLPLTGFLLLSV